MNFEVFAKMGTSFILRGIIEARHGLNAAAKAKQQYGRNIWGIRPEYSTDNLQVYKFKKRKIPAFALK